MKTKVFFIIRLAIAIILIQTLRFKFTGHPDSVYIFKQVNLEPVGRIFVGVLELVAGILLLIPKTVWTGAILTLAIMSGAIIMHLTRLGIEVNNDKGLLFITAIIVFVLSGITLYFYRKTIPFLK
ncbi:DoxX family membrane protein [Lacinutrix sp. MedPE-SW]|uniref:DoxX family membrane protein n=1 Tax=Lacinutrix sp. MedPE-SW TaxID=1860087 RepID=UPI00091CA7DB|nr:DoxX family membrane protein [Lacinutrix sp. MedPE-SW]OIQ16337.1 MAG: DoxX family protein [Lacinutrix sp. MedPE-SW]